MSTPLNSIDDGINTFDQPRHDWTRPEAQALYDLPFADLIFRAQGIHRRNFDPNHVETASLLSIKTGGCPEDCGYCSQSAHYKTDVKATRLMDRSAVVETARRAKDAGASRFCMAAAWRNPKDKDLDRVCEMVSAVKDLGMETCATLGMLTPAQAARLHDAGLVMQDENVRVTAALVQHPPVAPAFAYRFDAADRSIVISGDTAPTDEVVKACDGCDVLLHEVFNPHGDELKEEHWKEYFATFHSSPAELGEIARRARPKLLVVYHQVLEKLPEADLVKQIRKEYSGDWVSARDLGVY